MFLAILIGENISFILETERTHYFSWKEIEFAQFGIFKCKI